MEELLEIPWQLILTSFEIFLGCLFGFVLVLMKFPAARQLGKLVLAYSFLLITLLEPSLIVSQWQVVALIALFLYLYTRAFFSQKSRLSFFHLIPVVISVGLFLTPLLIDRIVGSVIVVTYGILLLRQVETETKQRGIQWFVNPGSRLSWFRNFITLNLIGLLLIISGFTDLYFITGLVLLVLLFIVYQAFKESDFLTPIPIGNKYQKSTLTPEIKSSIIGKLDKVMREERFYRRDDASLTALAELLGVTNHHLSQVLNDSLKISFQDLIARFRVREACMLLRDESNDQVKIENIATQVGYNSKSAFNTAFKRRTGLTPSEYRESKGVLIYGEEHLSEGKEPSNGGRSFSLNHVFKLKITSGMIQHFFKIFSRNVKRNGLFSFLNVLGLTVGFTCSILIYLYVQDELSYDRSLPDSDRIYRIAWMSDNPQTRTPHPMAQAMVADFPEVEAAVTLSPWYGPGLSRDKIRVKNVKTNVVFEEPDFYFGDSTFLDIFQLKVLEGDEDALSKPWSLVISEPMAKKYFGDSSAIGQELSMNGMLTEVSAVVEPMPEHSHFHFNAIIPYVTLKQINPESNWMTWADFGHFNYIKLKAGADPEELEAKMPEWGLEYIHVDDAMREIILSMEERFELQPISSIHLNSHLRWELENNGNILYIYILMIILAFLILIAAINYTNLTTAKSVERAKEIGVRKTLGATSKKLSGQFYMESIVFALIALGLSLLLAILLLEGFNSISGKQFQVSDIFNSSFLVKAVLIGMSVGLLAGFYPAVALSSFKPTEVLKGKLTTSSRGVRLRSALVVLQFTISAILICGSLIVYNQIQFMKDKDLGFDQDALISLNVPISVEKGGVDLEALRTTQTQLEGISGVKFTTLASSVPGGQFNQHGYFLRDHPENRVDASELMVDYGIEKVLGLEVVKGRIFDKTFKGDSVGGVVINEAFANQLNVENPVGKTLVQDASGREFESQIIGVIRDFHFQSLHQEIQPLLLAVQPLGAGNILVKLEGHQFGQTIEQIETVYNANIESELPFEYHFLDEELASLYAQEEQTLSIFSIFSIIALILASLGLLGMAIAILNQRIKEVGMRKILGASSRQIMGMILGQFVRLVGIALVIGLPLSYLLMQGWMAEFSYRAPLGIMPFVGAILVLVCVTFFSVISAVTKISMSNPVEALRYE